MTEASRLLDGLGSFGAHRLAEAEFRDRLARWFESFKGLRSSGPTEREYEQHVFERDDPAWRHAAADNMFSCALHWRALLRDLGVPHPLVTCRYRDRIGMAVADVAAVARHYGAIVEGPAVATYEPERGNAMLTGHGNAVHVSCIVRVTDGSEVETVDGGQGVRGDMRIDRNLYALERGAAGAFVRSIEPLWWSAAKPGPIKPVRWYADIWRLALNAGLLKALGLPPRGSVLRPALSPRALFLSCHVAAWRRAARGGSLGIWRGDGSGRGRRFSRRWRWARPAAATTGPTPRPAPAPALAARLMAPPAPVGPAPRARAARAAARPARAAARRAAAVRAGRPARVA